MAKPSEDRQKSQKLLQSRRDRAVELVRIWDVLELLGVSLRAKNRGKIHCIFPEHEERTASMKVYGETDSVYCFGCHRSGDVVEVVRCCAGDGKMWSVEAAVTWLEQKFDIEALPKLVTFSERLKSKLKTWRDRPDEPVVPAYMLAQTVTNRMAEVYNEAPPEIRMALWTLEDYIDEEFKRPGVNHQEWYYWALKLIDGYCRKLVIAMEEFKASPEWAQGLATVSWETELLQSEHLDFRAG